MRRTLPILPPSFAPLRQSTRPVAVRPGTLGRALIESTTVMVYGGRW
jgi:hypothetical protein